MYVPRSREGTGAVVYAISKRSENETEKHCDGVILWNSYLTGVLPQVIYNAHFSFIYLFRSNLVRRLYTALPICITLGTLSVYLTRPGILSPLYRVPVMLTKDSLVLLKLASCMAWIFSENKSVRWSLASEPNVSLNRPRILTSEYRCLFV